MIKEYESQMEKGPSVWHMTKRSLGYMLKIAWTEKKSVFFLYILKFFGAALSELKVLLLPKLLVDEIMAIKSGLPLEDHMQRILLYVGLTVGAELLSRFLGNIADSSLNWYSAYFDRILQYRLCTKSMEMDFQYTEEIKDPPQMISGIGTEYITGVIRQDSKYLIMLDIRRIFSAKEMQKIIANGNVE